MSSFTDAVASLKKKTVPTCRGALWSNGHGNELWGQESGVQIPPTNYFSQRIFETKEEEAEKENALANLTTRREREQRLMDANWKSDMWSHLTIL